MAWLTHITNRWTRRGKRSRLSFPASDCQPRREHHEETPRRDSHHEETRREPVFSPFRRRRRRSRARQRTRDLRGYHRIVGFEARLKQTIDCHRTAHTASDPMSQRTSPARRGNSSREAGTVVQSACFKSTSPHGPLVARRRPASSGGWAVVGPLMCGTACCPARSADSHRGGPRRLPACLTRRRVCWGMFRTDGPTPH
jgi:hypothetical protein